ncbi:uncharacterized protein LOC110835047 [Zootermopsis nevadensis]|uniref:uncharacterized protein LOC110835047 n=1 Tax=Zootermopsis nevadensis TaxID=136037 RepID=UPI000B8EA426|nr:uncharacterized protein LOC110835047 [Zootermopsis nevadensis]
MNITAFITFHSKINFRCSKHQDCMSLKSQAHYGSGTKQQRVEMTFAGFKSGSSLLRRGLPHNYSSIYPELCLQHCVITSCCCDYLKCSADDEAPPVNNVAKCETI